MRTLILGAHGIVGRALATETRRRGWPTLAVGRAQGDLEDRGRLLALATTFRPALVVNCAAFTQVDLCETRRDLALAVNGAGVGHVVAAAAAVGARTIQISSDYVFDGRATRPYREDDPTGPLSVYGESKLAGEVAALADPRALVVRSSWIFGAGGASFPAALLARMESGERSFRVVSDQTGAPTYAPFLARALADLGESGASGRIHYRNREPVTWYEFARAIARRVDPAIEVVPVPTREFPRPAPRPAYSVLDVERFERGAGRRVEEWERGLDDFLAARRKGALS